MPKVNRGGKRSATTSAFSLQNQSGTATSQQTQQILDDLADEDIINYSNYMKLSEDAKADALAQIIKNDVPDFLNDSATQKLLYYTDIEGKALTASDSALDKMKGTSLFRTVHDEYDSRQDVYYSAKQIYNQIVSGNYTRVSGSGGSAHGKGIYFADSYNSSTVYGTGNSKKDLTMRMKLNNNARVVNETTAYRGVQSAIKSNSKMGKLYRQMGSADATSVWALNNGYNVVKADWSGYYVVLDRRAMTVSTRTTNGTGSRW